jgi:predicted nucleic acid-binding protein
MAPHSASTLVDTNVWLDVITDDPNWGRWSHRALMAAAARGSLVINQLVYSELLVGFDAIEPLDDVLGRFGVVRAGLPWDAAFLTAKAYQRYRSSGGKRQSPMPDFYIGAHALVAGMKLLTRDDRVYRTYFPNVDVISP